MTVPREKPAACTVHEGQPDAMIFQCIYCYSTVYRPVPNCYAPREDADGQ